MAKVSPFLWFVGNMQEAVNFYVSIFKDARIVEMSPMSRSAGRPPWMCVSSQPRVRSKSSTQRLIGQPLPRE